MAAKLQEDIDYYFDEQNRWVFTAKYLSDRGYCCKNGCKHCPYGFEATWTKKQARLLAMKLKKGGNE